MSRTVPSLLAAALVVLAGCAGGIAGPGATSGGQASDSGTVTFYLSDRPGSIDQFSHLNVTVTKVGFKTAGEADASADVNETADADGNATGNTSTAADVEDGGEDDEGDAEDGDWVTRDVEDHTVDLTELRGANASLLGNVSVPAGEYEKVFVHVGEVNGTLQNGESVNVKLPSQKLHVNEAFAVGEDGSRNVDFVFDITVHEAGKSGKYVLKPVASESGTDVPIEVVDGEHAELRATVLGNVTAGENATVKVTRDGEAVSNASVRLDEEVVATTNANGTATVHVPENSEEVEITATVGGEGDDDEAEAEVELELGVGDDRADDGDDHEDDGADDGDEVATNATADLAVALDGDLAASEDVTVSVTDGDGDAVANATVSVDGIVVGRTDADGELTFTVPADATMESDLTVTADGASVTLDAGAVATAN